MGRSDDLPPGLGRLADLVGTWQGRGTGEYPSIDSFAYRERVVVTCPGKPLLRYEQRTVRLDTGQPAHTEVGYIRPVGSDRCELVLAHPTGLAEVSEGEIVPTEGGIGIDLRSSSIAGTDTAREVSEVRRAITVAGDLWRYTLGMAATGHPLTHHLEAVLRRVG